MQSNPWSIIYLFVMNTLLLQILSATLAILGSEGEAKEKAAKEYMEHMSTLENGIAKDLSSWGTFIHGERPGLLDVIVSSCYSGLKDSPGFAPLPPRESSPC